MVISPTSSVRLQLGAAAAAGWRSGSITGRVRACALAVLIGLGAGPLPSSASPEAAPLRVHGSTTVNSTLIQPHLDRLQRRAGVTLDIIASKSIWGLVALAERRADVAMISSSLEAELAVYATSTGTRPPEGLRAFEIARSNVAFAVHPRNPVRNLTLRQVRAMLLGEIRNWKEVGGTDMPVRVVATQDGGGTVAAVRAQLLGGQGIAAPGAIRLESAKHVVKVVAQEPGALAIAQLGLTREAGLGEVATDKTVEQVLCFVTIGAPTPPVDALIAAAREIAAESAD